MSRLTISIRIVLAVFLFTISAGIGAAEIARYDDGPSAGMGYPYSESARAGNLVFCCRPPSPQHPSRLRRVSGQDDLSVGDSGLGTDERV